MLFKPLWRTPLEPPKATNKIVIFSLFIEHSHSFFQGLALFARCFINNNGALGETEHFEILMGGSCDRIWRVRKRVRKGIVKTNAEKSVGDWSMYSVINVMVNERAPVTFNRMKMFDVNKTFRIMG
jgi:hypothetical protein